MEPRTSVLVEEIVVSKENISMRRAWPFIMSYNEGEKKSE